MLSPKISFVVPVRNDAERLEISLRAIRASGLEPHEIEIVVPDNGSEDESVEIAERAGASVLHLPGLTVAALRNRGAAEATGDILAFCDSDNVIVPSWARTACDLLAVPGVGGVGALCLPPYPPTWVQRSYDGLRDHKPGTRDARWLGAGNMAVRREIFLKVGGFDEELISCEDVDLCKKILNANWGLLSDSRLENVHLGDPETLNQLFRGELWRGRDNLKVSLRPPLKLGDLPGIAVPIVYLLCLGGLVVGAVTAPFGGFFLSSTGLYGMIGLSAIRAAAMVMRKGSAGLKLAAQVFVVASTFDLARALALLIHSSHHR